MEAQTYLLDTPEPIRFVLTCHACMVELPLTIFDVNKSLNKICSSHKMVISLQKTWIKPLIHMYYFYNLFMNVLMELTYNGGTKISQVSLKTLKMTNSLMGLEQNEG